MEKDPVAGVLVLILDSGVKGIPVVFRQYPEVARRSLLYTHTHGWLFVRPGTLSNLPPPNLGEIRTYTFWALLPTLSRTAPTDSNIDLEESDPAWFLLVS